MVCFVDGKAKKSAYRKYKIKGKQTPDDFAMMREVLRRRYTRLVKENEILPDLVMVDGGKGQLSSALAVLRELNLNDQAVIGLAKRLEEVFIPGYPEAQMLPKSSASLKLLQRIRDEAHRFAISYHRDLRKKRTVSSILDQIPGIGPRRRTQLLNTFKSVRNLKMASADEIHKKADIPVQLANTVYQYLQEH